MFAGGFSVPLCYDLTVVGNVPLFCLLGGRIHHSESISRAWEAVSKDELEIAVVRPLTSWAKI